MSSGADAFGVAVTRLCEAQYDAGKCAGAGDCGSPGFHITAMNESYAALLAAHAAAVNDAEQAAWQAGLDEGRVQGRAAALREVDEACESLAAAGAECGTSPHSLRVVALERDSWGHGVEWQLEDGVSHAPTPTAAILRRAAALRAEAQP